MSVYLEDESSEDAAEYNQQIGQGEAEDEDSKLPVTKPGLYQQKVGKQPM
jgi:hypothetical protein